MVLRCRFWASMYAMRGSKQGSCQLARASKGRATCNIRANLTRSKDHATSSIRTSPECGTERACKQSACHTQGPCLRTRVARSVPHARSVPSAGQACAVLVSKGRAMWAGQARSVPARGQARSVPCCVAQICYILLQLLRRNIKPIGRRGGSLV